MSDINEQQHVPDNSAAVSHTLEINVAGEKVQFTVPVPSGPVTWDDILPFMRALVKVGSDISQEYFAERGKPVSCKAGCGICCRQRVPLAEFEAHRLRRLVDAMPEPRRSEIIARFQAVEERVREARDTIRLDAVDGDTPLSLKEMAQRAGAYFRLMIPCPFLENESCSIYDERPLKCREYLVTSPAENCAEPSRLPVVGLPLPLEVSMATLFLDQDPQDSGIRWVPLDEMMSWTDSHTPAPPSRSGSELLHEFMSRLMRPRT
ncbi:MAG: YkgJ family cysteine cluster protein [Planctomycetaceae bacterium]